MTNYVIYSDRARAQALLLSYIQIDKTYNKAIMNAFFYLCVIENDNNYAGYFYMKDVYISLHSPKYLLRVCVCVCVSNN